MPNRKRCILGLPGSKSAAGFTLIELMIVLVIFAILAVIAMPSFQRMYQNQQLVEATNELIAGLTLARSEALMRESEVRVCPGAAEETACQKVDGDWGNGWAIVADSGGEIMGHDALPASIHVVQASGAVAFDRLGYTTEQQWRLQVGSAGATRWVCLSPLGGVYSTASPEGCSG